MKQFAATLTVTGILGFIILEALKMLMEPVVAWVLGVLAVGLKILLIVLGVSLGLAVLGLSIFVFLRYRRAQEAEVVVE